MKTYRNRRAPRACGFTLVELLVVIAIIGILIGMLLPAIQQVREAARRTQCINNLSQISLAAHNYDFSAGHLPPGVLDKAGPIVNKPQGQHTSFLVHLLPFLDQQGIYNNFDINAGAYAAANGPAVSLVIPTFECPSTFTPVPVLGGPASSNYAGCHHGVEAPIDADNNGLLFLNSAIRYGDIYDGSSNTILLGEKLCESGNLGWASGTRATLRNGGEILEQDGWELKYGTAAPGPVGPNVVGGFSSVHPGNVNFAMADGSVHSGSVSVNLKLLNELANRKDGAMMGEIAW